MSDTAVNVVAIWANDGELLTKAAAEIEKLRAALKQAKRDALEEAARECDKRGAATSADAIRALGEKA